MALDTHYKQQYIDNVRDLAGGQERSLLKELVSKESKTGEAVFIDSIGAADDATVTAQSAVKTRAKDGAADYAAFLALQTPHMNVEKQRTLITSKLVEWGHTIDRFDKLNEVTDPQSRILRQGMKRFFYKEDSLIINALMAQKVMRGKDTGTVAAVAMPAGQQMTLLAQASGASGFGTKVISEIKKRFEKVYYNGRIYCVISPSIKKAMIDSDDKLTNKDFVDSGRYFTTGELPDIYGVNFIVHPMLEAALTDDADVPLTKFRYFAWAPEGIVWNEFEALQSEMDKDPGEKFNVKCYTHEAANAVRIDDSLVVQGTLTALT